MVPPTYILLGIGFVGILIVLMFATSMGVSNGALKAVQVNTGVDQCDQGNRVPKPIPRNQVVKKASYNLSHILPVGQCPTGYTVFNDVMGNTLCCASSRIDPYSHSCPANGADGICAMSPGIEDSRNLSGDVRHYPLCQDIAKQQQAEKSGRLCPRRYPTYIPLPGGGQHKCCGGPASPGGTDCMSTKSCLSLVGQGQNVFNTPSSCEKALLLEKIQCPPGTNLVSDMKGTSSRTKNLSLPICVGVTGNCFDKTVLQKMRDLGALLDINIEKNILNCDIYNKVYNDRLMTESQAETVAPVDLS
jgi:hypothetical protein